MTARKVFIQRSRFVCQISIHIANDGDADNSIYKQITDSTFQSTSPMMAMPSLYRFLQVGLCISIHIANDGDAR